MTKTTRELQVLAFAQAQRDIDRQIRRNARRQWWRRQWQWLIGLLGMWCLLATVALAQMGGWQHDRIGRKYASCTCQMCVSDHLIAAHGVNGWDYANPWAIHHSLHHPSKPKPKKLTKPRLPFNPTPMAELSRLTEIVQPRSTDIVIDPGCGDGRLLIALCKESGAQGIGYEINPDIAKLARKNIKDAGLEGRISIWQVDSRLVNLTGATCVVMYLFPKLIRELDFTGARVVASYQHEITDGQKVGSWYVKHKKVF